MIAELIKDKQFIELEKEYKFLARARGEAISSLEYVVLDIETTGLEPTQDEITEIGAMKIKGKEVQDIFSSLVKPQKPISAEITKLTGIDDELVKDAPPIDLVLPKFIDFINSAVLIAHNADFDAPFIKYHLKRITATELTNSIICTVKLSRFLLPQLPNHKLHTVASHFGLKVENRHRAMGDVELTYQIWINFMDLLQEKGITYKHDLDSLILRL